MKNALLLKMLPLFLIIPLVIIAVPLSKEGSSIGGRDFPFLSTPDYVETKIFTWTENGSNPGFDRLSRLPMIWLSYILSQIGITSEFISKAIIVLGFGLASYSFYFSFFHILKEKFANAGLSLRVAILLGSIYYAYNVWSFNRIGHWYLWIGYAVLPLFIYSVVYSFKQPNKWRYVLLSVFLATIAASTPHMLFFYAITFVIILAIFSIENIIKRKHGYALIKPVVSIVSLFLLLNSFWVIPSALLAGYDVLRPSYVNTEEIFEILSRDSNVLNVIRLVQDWVLPHTVSAEPPSTSPLFSAWVASSIVIPLLAFSAIILRRNDKLVLMFSALAIIGILLTMGSLAPIDFYSTILFSESFAFFSWIFRDPDKWAFTIALSFATLGSIAMFEILKRLGTSSRILHRTLAISFVAIILLSNTIYAHNMYSDTFEKKFDPVMIPNDFELLNNYLTNNIESDKVVFLPTQPAQTTWSQGHKVDKFYEISSAKPNISESSSPDMKKYFRYLTGLILANKTSSISDLIYPFGTSYIIYHDDTRSQRNAELRNKLSAAQEIQQVDEIGFFKVFRAEGGEGEGAAPNNISSDNFAVIGGLDVMGTLKDIESFDSRKSSILFLDYYGDSQQKKEYLATVSDTIIIANSRGSQNLLPALFDEEYFVAPISATSHHRPAVYWSKAGTSDPLHGPFNSHLSRLGLSNWDYDYGKGLVLTWASSAALSIPFTINEAGNYDIFIRYLKSPEGGAIRVGLDDMWEKEINTFDNKNNNKNNNPTAFEWNRIESAHLEKGEHTLTLENIRGFNAVNVFAVVPIDRINELRNEVNEIIEDKRILYLSELEPTFLVQDNISLFESPGGSFREIVEGQIQVPAGTDFLSFQFLAEQQQGAGQGNYEIENINVVPVCDENYFSSDFEVDDDDNDNDEQSWINEDRDNLSTSIETDNPISGDKSLQVDIRQGNRELWSTIATDFLPATSRINYHHQLSVSTTNVNQLHAKVQYYDADRQLIKSDIIFPGRDGTFEETYSNSFISPDETKYIRLQLFAKTNPLEPSSYLLDDVTIQQPCPESVLHNSFDGFINLSPGTQLVATNNSLQVISSGPDDDDDDDDKDNNITMMPFESVIETQPIRVIGDRAYEYQIEVHSENLDNFHANAQLMSSRSLSSKQDNQAINNDVLVVPPNSQITSSVDVLKDSTYTIAIRAKTCDECSYMRVSAGSSSSNNDNNDSQEISLNQNESALEWFYFNTYLQKGENRVTVYADSETEIDSIIIYSSSEESSGGGQEQLGDVFVGSSSNSNNSSSPPARIESYERINPTKHVLTITASEPYVLSFSESYDPLWTVSIDGNTGEEVQSMPLFSIINGFQINETGTHVVTIEYKLQYWSYIGATISIITLVLLPVFIMRAHIPVVRELDRILVNLGKILLICISIIKVMRDKVNGSIKWRSKSDVG